MVIPRARFSIFSLMHGWILGKEGRLWHKMATDGKNISHIREEVSYRAHVRCLLSAASSVQCLNPQIVAICNMKLYQILCISHSNDSIHAKHHISNISTEEGTLHTWQR